MGLQLCRADFVLRPTTLTDARALYAWRCSPRIADMMLSAPPATFEEHLGYLERVLGKPDRFAFYTLCYRTKPIGHVGLKLGAEDATVADWTIYVGAEDAPVGSGFVLGLLGLDRLFARPGLAALRTEILAENDRSSRLHRRLGFSAMRRRKDLSGREVVLWSIGVNDWLERRLAASTTAFGTVADPTHLKEAE